MKKLLYRFGLAIVAIGAIATLVTTDNNLFSSSTAYAIGELTIDWGVPEGNPIFTVTSAAPGQTESRPVVITNNAPVSRTVGVRSLKTDEIGAISSQLSIEIATDGTPVYGTGSGTGTKTLAQFFVESSDPDGITLLTLASGDDTTLTVSLTFDSASNNSAQNNRVVFNLTLGIVTEVPAECDDITFAGLPIMGTAGRDNLRGTRGNDLIIGLEGNDNLRGEGGNDCIVGGSGNDNMRGDAGNDVLFGEAGNDQMRGDGGNDYLDGGEGNDNLRGDAGHDSIFGRLGNDTIRGDAGNDQLQGNEGNDQARGDGGSDTCDAETEHDCEL